MERELAIFKVLSDRTRLRLAVMLAVMGEVCVCKLSEALDEPEYKVSRHLGVLRNAGLVSARREGTWMHYQLSDAGCVFDEEIHAMLRGYFAELKDVKKDLKAMAKCGC